jgi:hypothetical protein
MNIGKFSLGGTAAIMTSMGLIVGLTNAASPRASIIGGLLIIAVADNVSDSFSLHVYKECETPNRAEVLRVTLGNFVVRLIVALSFVAMVILLPAGQAVVCACLWGLLLLGLLSYHLSETAAGRSREVLWHLGVAVLVIAASKFLGAEIAEHF